MAFLDDYEGSCTSSETNGEPCRCLDANVDARPKNPARPRFCSFLIQAAKDVKLLAQFRIIVYIGQYGEVEKGVDDSYIHIHLVDLSGCILPIGTVLYK